jgi:hypothetical protein
MGRIRTAGAVFVYPGKLCVHSFREFSTDQVSSTFSKFCILSTKKAFIIPFGQCTYPSAAEIRKLCSKANINPFVPKTPLSQVPGPLEYLDCLYRLALSGSSKLIYPFNIECVHSSLFKLFTLRPKRIIYDGSHALSTTANGRRRFLHQYPPHGNPHFSLSLPDILS